MEGAENKSMLQQKEVEAAKGDNLGNKQQSGAHKTPIQNGKSNHTVPRPFMFATEKRISREKRGSMDLNESKQKLSKSVSFNTSARRIVPAPISSKKNQGDASGKSSVFKALPLPSFYNNNNHPSTKLSQNKKSAQVKPAKSAEDKPSKVPASIKC